MAKVRTIVLGTGGIARWHLRNMYAQRRTTEVVALVDPSTEVRARTTAFLRETCGVEEPPPCFDDFKAVLKAGVEAEAMLIATPHSLHYAQAMAGLKAGLHLLIEKPMVLSAREARALIKARDQADRIVSVAFPGSFSPALQKAQELLAKGTLGNVGGIEAHAWQQWLRGTVGTWRQDPAISGGGFLFDTGSHMVNTVVELGGADVGEVYAQVDNCGSPVEINSTVTGRFRHGVFFAMTAMGNSIQGHSQVRVFGDEGVLETGIWGERLNLMLRKKEGWQAVKYRPQRGGVWSQFVRVLDGRRANPCPPEVGLRFAKLMDGIRQSAAEGRLVKLRAS